MPVTEVGKIFKPALRALAATAAAEAALAAAGLEGAALLSADAATQAVSVRLVTPVQRQAVLDALAPLPLRWDWV